MTIRTLSLQRSVLPVALVLFLCLTAACAFVGPPVHVAGTARDLARIEGSWFGEYSVSGDNPRHGTISFKLIADRREAHGSVLMQPEGAPNPYRQYRGDPDMRPLADSRPAASLLSIRFVFIGDGEVTGELDPYWDPDRNTVASTVFVGVVDGGTIAGRFQTRFRSGLRPTEGRWSATRGS